MNKEFKEFDIDSVTLVDARYCVRGACNQGNITIQDIFLLAYRYRIQKSVVGLRYEFKNLGKTDIREVKLQVIRIKAYNRDLDELAKGMSGELYLKGEGGHLLKTRDYLAL